MSNLIVEVVVIDEVKSHDSADRLSLAIVKGWQVVIQKDQYKSGDLAVYIPPASMIPEEVSDRFGFTQYLSKGRLKSVRLRGEPSHGILIPNEGPWEVGTDVADHYGITKYIPPRRSIPQEDHTIDWSPHPLFQKYTEIENLRHFPDVIHEGEEVIITEKVHGTNVRVGVIDGKMMAGSKNHARKMPTRIFDWATAPWWQYVYAIFSLCILRRPLPETMDCEAVHNHWYWSPFLIPGVMTMLEELGERHEQVILFGETYGKNVQKGVRYGKEDVLGFAAFDLLIDGRYVDYDKFVEYCTSYAVPTVPIVAREPFSLQKVREHSEGKTLIGGDTHIREGVVVKPISERVDPKIGRVILKFVSDDYLTAKEIGDFEDE